MKYVNTITDAVENALELANSTGSKVRFDFNTIGVTVYPGDTVRKGVYTYYANCPFTTEDDRVRCAAMLRRLSYGS